MKHYSLQGTVFLGSALQIQALPPYKTNDNDFTFWSTFAHTTKPSFTAETKTPLTDVEPSGYNDHIIYSCFQQL